MSNLPAFFKKNSPTGNPLRDLMRMQHQMDRFFDELWNSGPFVLQVSPLNAPAFTPSSDVQETESHYLMSFDLPGVKKDDIKIDLRDDVLTVSGERNEERPLNREDKTGQKYQSERFYGAFERSFQVPKGTTPEQIEAHYADGVLKVAVPKTEAAKAQRIKISEGKAGFWDKLLGHPQSEQRVQVKVV